MVSTMDITVIDGYNERIAQSIQYQTISYEDTSLIDYNEFFRFHEFLKANFPIVFEKLSCELINTYSILLKWDGSDSSLKPGILMAHQDVVPAAPETENLWLYPAFDGAIVNDTLYGRGTVDNRINLMAQMEALNYLLQQDFRSLHTIQF